jgi:hypothetical protein
MQKLWVISGNRHEYNNYITEKDRKGEDMRNLVYLTDANKLHGYSEVHGVFIGTWRNRTDINEIIYKIGTINGKAPVAFVLGDDSKITTKTNSTIASVNSPGITLSVANDGTGTNKVEELEMKHHFGVEE